MKSSSSTSKTLAPLFLAVTLGMPYWLNAAGHRATTFGTPPGSVRQAVLYVANSRGNDIAVVDLGTLRIRDRIRLGDRVHGLATDASGRSLFATVESDNTLRIINTLTDGLLATIP